MKMKRCKCCGWWFEPKTPRQSYCDEECKREWGKVLHSRYNKKRYAQKKAEKAKEAKKPSILKVDVAKLPAPVLPPTKEYRGTTMADRKLQSMFEMMERRRQFDSL